MQLETIYGSGISKRDRVHVDVTSHICCILYGEVVRGTVGLHDEQPEIHVIETICCLRGSKRCGDALAIYELWKCMIMFRCG
jgi:dTDP-D-glucose 4,6-dehydratase